MRVVRRLGIVSAIALLLLGVGGLRFVPDAYPADPFKSEALRNCLANDRGFIRFSSEQRANCYARQPQLSSVKREQDASR